MLPLALIAFAQDMYPNVLCHNIEFLKSYDEIVVLLTKGGKRNDEVKKFLQDNQLHFEEYDTDDCFKKYRLFLEDKPDCQVCCFDNTLILTEIPINFSFENYDFVFSSKKVKHFSKLFEKNPPLVVAVFETHLMWIKSSEKFLSIESWENPMRVENSKSLDLPLNKPKIVYEKDENDQVIVPRDFHPARYLNANLDLCAFLMPSDSLKHFVMFGHNEHRPYYENQPGNVV